MFKNAVGSLIVSLLQRCCPTAVPGLVIPIHPDSVDGGSVWTRIHILYEISGITPSVADSYSATTITMVVTVLGIRATLNHAGPHPVYRRAAHSVPAVPRPSQGMYTIFISVLQRIIRLIVLRRRLVSGFVSAQERTQVVPALSRHDQKSTAIKRSSRMGAMTSLTVAHRSFPLPAPGLGRNTLVCQPHTSALTTNC